MRFLILSFAGFLAVLAWSQNLHAQESKNACMDESIVGDLGKCTFGIPALLPFWPSKVPGAVECEDRVWEHEIADIEDVVAAFEAFAAEDQVRVRRAVSG